MWDGPRHCQQPCSKEAMFQEAEEGLSNSSVHQAQGGDRQGAQGGVWSSRSSQVFQAKALRGANQTVTEDSHTDDLRVTSGAHQVTETARVRVSEPAQQAGGPVHRRVPDRRGIRVQGRPGDRGRAWAQGGGHDDCGVRQLAAFL